MIQQRILMNKRTILVVVSITILAGVSGWGFWYWQNSAIQTKTTQIGQDGQTKVGASVEAGVKAISEEDLDTSKWKTYRNEEYGFEFKYPESQVVLVNDTFEGGNSQLPSFQFKNGGHFSIGIWQNLELETPEAFLDEKYGEYSGGWRGDFEKMNAYNGKSFTLAKLVEDSCLIEYVIYTHERGFLTLRLERCGNGIEETERIFDRVARSVDL